MRVMLRVAMMATIMWVAGACGGDDLRDEIADNILASAHGMISESEAECAADAIIDALGRENARNYASLMAGDLEAAGRMEPITAEQEQAISEGLEACDFEMMRP
jgi:hypothetical protein